MAVLKSMAQVRSATKHLYCPVDRRLVSVKEIKQNNEVELACQRCGARLWHKAGFKWIPIANPVAAKK